MNKLTKRISLISLILVFCISAFFCFGNISHAANTANEVTLKIENAAALAGEEVTVTLKLTSGKILGFDVGFSFDTAKLTYISSNNLVGSLNQNGRNTSEMLYIDRNNEQSGNISIVYEKFGLMESPENGLALFSFKFRLAEGLEIGDYITIKSDEYSNHVYIGEREYAVATEYDFGKIVVGESADIKVNQIDSSIENALNAFTGQEYINFTSSVEFNTKDYNSYTEPISLTAGGSFINRENDFEGAIEGIINSGSSSIDCSLYIKDGIIHFSYDDKVNTGSATTTLQSFTDILSLVKTIEDRELFSLEDINDLTDLTGIDFNAVYNAFLEETGLDTDKSLTKLLNSSFFKKEIIGNKYIFTLDNRYFIDFVYDIILEEYPDIFGDIGRDSLNFLHKIDICAEIELNSDDLIKNISFKVIIPQNLQQGFQSGNPYYNFKFNVSFDYEQKQIGYPDYLGSLSFEDKGVRTDRIVNSIVLSLNNPRNYDLQINEGAVQREFAEINAAKIAEGISKTDFKCLDFALDLNDNSILIAVSDKDEVFNNYGIQLAEGQKLITMISKSDRYATLSLSLINTDDIKAEMVVNLSATVEESEYIRRLDGKYYFTNYDGKGTSCNVLAQYNGNAVIGIGKSAFWDNDALQSVIIEEGIKTIDNSAFGYCSELKTVELPDSLTTIGDSAFSGCPKLEYLYISENVNSIGKNAFLNCGAVIEVSPDNLYYTDKNGIIYNKDMTEIICMSADVKNVVIPASVKKIGTAFQKTSVETVIFEEGCQVTEFDDYAFENCKNLKSIVIPKSITSLGDFAFTDCSSLYSVTFEEGSLLKYLGNEEFYNTVVTEIEIPETVLETGRNIFGFYGYGQLTVRLNWLNPTENQLYFINTCSQEMAVIIPDGTLELYSVYSNYNAVFIEESEITGGGFVIRYYEGDTVLLRYLGSEKNITIPGDVTSIDERVFPKNGTGYKSITFLSENPPYIPYYVFEIWNSNDTCYIIVPENSLQAYKDSFKYYSENIITGSDIQEGGFVIGQQDEWTENGIINVKVLIKYIGTEKNITIPADIYYINYSAFANCDITSVFISKEVRAIKENAFQNCSSLTSVIFEAGSNLVTIGSNAFADTGLSEIILPAKLEYIGYCALKGINNIITDENNSNFKILNGMLFNKDYTCLYYALPSSSSGVITIPASVTEICQGTFSSLDSSFAVFFEVGSSLEILNGAFKESKISSIFIPASISSLNYFDFYNCFNLETINFEEGSGIGIIDFGVFSSTIITNIELPENVKIIYNLSDSNISEITVNPQNLYLIIEDGILYNKEKTILYCVLSVQDDGTIEILNTVETINEDAFNKILCEYSVSFESGSILKEIKQNLFSNSEIYSIIIPASIESIGENAFYYCQNLSTVQFEEGSSLKTIKSYAFYCTELKEITLPDTVENINYYAFYSNSYLKIYFQGDVETMQQAFNNSYTTVYGSGDNLENYSDDFGFKMIIGSYDMSKVNFADVELLYDGSAKNISISGNLPSGVTVKYYIGSKEFSGAVNIGTYIITAKFTGDEHYNAIANKTATLTVNKDTYDMSGISFVNSEFKYDGSSKTITINGTLPSGVTVKYYVNNAEFSGAVNAGTYLITAKFTGDSANYNIIEDKTATITINKEKGCFGQDVAKGVMTISISFMLFFIIKRKA